MERFKDVLKASNLKSTHQRLAILDSIDQFGHIDIDTLFDVIIRKYPTMSKATLYRNINDLINFHILEEVKLPHQKQQYEIKKYRIFIFYVPNAVASKIFLSIRNLS